MFKLCKNNDLRTISNGGKSYFKKGLLNKKKTCIGTKYPPLSANCSSLNIKILSPPINTMHVITTHINSKHIKGRYDI